MILSLPNPTIFYFTCYFIKITHPTHSISPIKPFFWIANSTIFIFLPAISSNNSPNPLHFPFKTIFLACKPYHILTLFTIKNGFVRAEMPQISFLLRYEVPQVAEKRVFVIIRTLWWYLTTPKVSIAKKSIC